MAKVDYGTLPPLPSRDANGRMGATRVGKVLDLSLREAVKALADGALVAPGTALPGWPDLVLVEAVIRPPAEGESAPQLVETYAEATSTWTQVGPDIEDRELNGLLRVRRTLVAKGGTVLPSLTVGTTTGPSSTILASMSTEGSTNAVGRLSLAFLQPGVISKAKGGGPAGLPGTIRHTWQVWHLTAAEAGMPGIITDEDEDNVQGYPVRRFTSISSGGGGSPEGILASYPTTLEITRHGTVQVAVSADDGGDTPYLVQTPPRSGRIAATVTIELTTTPAVPVPAAFNLDNVSVTVVSKTRTRGYVGSDPSSTIAGHVYAERINMEHTTLRGYVYVSSAANGVEQAYSYPGAVNADDDTIAGEAFYSYIYRTLTLSGSTTAPASSGLYSRDADPVFTASNGTKWYRQTTITI